MTNRHSVITGNDGFVGKHLENVLTDGGYSIIPFSIQNGKDVRKEKDFESLPPAEIIFHLAALVSIPASWDTTQEVLDTNIIGTLNVLKYAKECKAKVIFMNTSAYGNPQYLPIDEKHLIIPESPYEVSKTAAEQLCYVFSKRYALPVVSLRCFNIYGPGQPDVAVVPQMIKTLLTEKKITIFDSTPKRDFVYVEDVVRALVAAAHYEPQTFDIFNIASGKSIAIGKLAKKLIEISGIKGATLLDKKEKRPNEILEKVADISKAKKELKWFPKVSLEEGLRQTLKSYK